MVKSEKPPAHGIIMGHGLNVDFELLEPTSGAAVTLPSAL